MWTITLFIGLWNNWYFASITCIPVIDTFKPYVPGLIPTIVIVVILWTLTTIIHVTEIITLSINTCLSGFIILFFIQYFKVIDIMSLIKKNKVK